jgi:hypothetical protein
VAKGAPQVIGEATDHDGLIQVFRHRKAALGLSDLVLDDLAGLCQGHAGKLLGPRQVKSLERITLSSLLGALALRLVVIEDVEQAARMRSRWERRRETFIRNQGEAA